MSYVGKLAQNDLVNFIIPAYENFKNMSYDVSCAKTILKDFIVQYCATHSVPCPPNNISGYNMNTYGIGGLSMTPKHNNLIKYLFSVKTGETYVVEFTMPTQVFALNPNIPFEFCIMTLGDTESVSYKPCYLLSPKL
jgi:hypothetical protein